MAWLGLLPGLAFFSLLSFLPRGLSSDVWTYRLRSPFSALRGKRSPIFFWRSDDTSSNRVGDPHSYPQLWRTWLVQVCYRDTFCFIPRLLRCIADWRLPCYSISVAARIATGFLSDRGYISGCPLFRDRPKSILRRLSLTRFYRSSIAVSLTSDCLVLVCLDMGSSLSLFAKPLRLLLTERALVSSCRFWVRE